MVSMFGNEFQELALNGNSLTMTLFMVVLIGIKDKTAPKAVGSQGGCGMVGG